LSTQDGRRSRGAVRRRELVDATLRLLERDGADGVTHRAVGREAGVSAASVGYHFAGIDDLLVSAMVVATEEWTATLPPAGGETPDDDGDDAYLRRLATVLADDVREHRRRVVAEYELYLLAARRPALRPAATAWLEAAVGPLATGLDDTGRRMLLAVLDGICLQGLLVDDPPGDATILAVLRRGLAGARGDGSRGPSRADPGPQPPRGCARARPTAR
jgi:DNA-binding transcriptional regulator YbjK